MGEAMYIVVFTCIAVVAALGCHGLSAVRN
jgi:hypothetical protein